MSNEEQKEADKKRVADTVQNLMEHFDTVQIFVTRHMPAEVDGTLCLNRGNGHWCARYGQIREWLVYEDERIKICARKSEEE